MGISRETVRDFFRNNASRSVDLNRPMLWGFFFTDRSKRRLAMFVPELERLGLRFVTVFAAHGVEGLHFLHAEIVATYTADELFHRCNDLAILALRHRLLTFDGFDVGNVDGSPLEPA